MGFYHAPAAIGQAFMRAFGLSHSDDKTIMSIDLHVEHCDATLTVGYKTRTPDLSEVAEHFRIVPRATRAIEDADPVVPGEERAAADAFFGGAGDGHVLTAPAEDAPMSLMDIAEVVCKHCRCDPDRAMAAAAEIFEAQRARRYTYAARAGEVAASFSAPTAEGVQSLIRSHEQTVTEQPRPVYLGGVGSIR